MSERITEADLRACTMHEVAHYNGGPEWFGYGYQCIEHPRLGSITRYYRKTKSSKSTFSVDGKEVKDLAEAAERLNFPAELTDEEREVYERVPVEFERCKDERFPFLVMHALSSKGKVEFKDGKARRLP